MSLLKKFTLAFLSFLVLFGSLAPNLSVAKAADPWYSQSFFGWYDKVYDPTNQSEIFGERYTAAQVQWVTFGAASMLVNLIPGAQTIIICTTQADVTACVDTAINSIETALGIGSAGSSNQNLASSVFNLIGQNPISAATYFENLSNKFSLVSSVKAQGVGYSTAANSVLKLWTITRNISYGLIVVAAIVLAFMIMFRVKISPQVVVSVQSAIPKLILSLILITFSYAIAGLLIDLMYVVIGLLAAIIGGGVLSSQPISTLFTNFTTGANTFGLIFYYWVHFLAAIINATSSGGLSMAVTLPGGIYEVLLMLLTIITFVVLLWWSIKIVWVLIKNFAMLMLTIVIGPLEIMLGTVTGAAGFGSWFKKMLSYLAVYPVLFFLSFFFLNQGMAPAPTGFATHTPFWPAANMITSNSWSPPLSLLANGGSQQLIWVLVSFVIFGQITKVAEMVQTFIAGKPWAYGTAMGEVLNNPAASLAKLGIGTAGQTYEGRLKARTGSTSKTEWFLSQLLQRLGK
jgi:hypothetical protein